MLKLALEAQTTNRIKALSYLQEAQKMESDIADTTLLNLYNTAGIIYKDQESYYVALNYFYKLLDLQEKIKPSGKLFTYNNIGGCYYLLRDKNKARKFWENALSEYKLYDNVPGSDLSKGSLIYNNLAVLEKDEKNYARAFEMLNEFKSQNEKFKDTLNIIMAYENLTDVYIHFKENQSAVKGLWKALKLSEQIKSDYDIASLYNKLGQIYLYPIQQKDSAFFYLQRTFKMSERHGFVDLKLSSAEKLVNYYKGENNFKQALHYLSLAKQLSEQRISRDNKDKISRLEFEFNEKIKQREIITHQKKKEYFFICGLTALLLFSVIIFLMFKLQKNISLKKAAENRTLIEQLEVKNKELTVKAIHMLQTSEMIESTHKELQEMKAMTASPSHKLLTRVITDLKNGSHNFNKSEFEKLLIEIDGNFYKNLVNTYPTLTKNEIRLCAFLKLNLSSKEISAITQQTPHSIVVARSRLRKKLGIEESSSLTNFLFRF